MTIEEMEQELSDAKRAMVYFMELAKQMLTAQEAINIRMQAVEDRLNGKK